MRVECFVVRKRSDVLACQMMIAETYSTEYGVVFSRDRFDLEAKIEPWPHRYVAIRIDGVLAATSGLYLSDTYVERFGDVSDTYLAEALAAHQADRLHSPLLRREISKFVVGRDWRGRGISRLLVRAAFSKAFLQLDAAEPHYLLMCARSSVWQNIFHRNGIKTRVLKPFPFYKVHEHYRSCEDPMDSRMIIPGLDIPEDVYQSALPTAFDIELPEVQS